MQIQTMQKKRQREAREQVDMATRLIWLLAPKRINPPVGDMGVRSKGLLLQASVMALGRWRATLEPGKGVN